MVKTTPPDATCELGAQVVAARGLLRRLPEQLVTAAERAVELVVQVVAVGDDDDGRVLQLGLGDDLAGVEGHRQALAAALRVPHHADAPVARLVDGAHRLCDRLVDRPELVIGGHLLGDGRPVVFEDHEVPDEVEQARRFEHAAHERLERGCCGRLHAVAVDRAPGREALPVGRERAGARDHPVRDDQQLIADEQVRDLLLVGLELLEGGVRRGLLVAGALELHDPQRQAVDEQHHIWTPLDLVLDDGELVDGEKVVGLGMLEVDEPDLVAAGRAVGLFDLNVDAVDEQPVETAVVQDQRRVFHAQHSARRPERSPKAEGQG